MHDPRNAELPSEARTWPRRSRWEAIIWMLRQPQPQPRSSRPEQKWSTGPVPIASRLEGRDDSTWRRAFSVLCQVTSGGQGLAGRK